MIFIAMVLVHLIMVDLFLTFLLLIAIVLVLMGDMFFGYKVVVSDVKPIMEPTPKGKELMELQQIDGRVRFINTTKGAHGKRSFRRNGEDARVMNDGKAPFRLDSGNHGFCPVGRIERNAMVESFLEGFRRYSGLHDCSRYRPDLNPQ